MRYEFKHEVYVSGIIHLSLQSYLCTMCLHLPYLCWHETLGLCPEWHFLGDKSMHVKWAFSMDKEHSISAVYRPLYHFHIGSRPPYNQMLIMAHYASQWRILVQWWILVIVPHGLLCTLLWYYETRLLGERPEMSLCFYLLVWPQIKLQQRHQTCVENKGGKRDTDKRVRCIYECSYNSSGYYQPLW